MQQEAIISAIERVLKAGGVLYLCDFLITRSERYLQKYQIYAQPEEEIFGQYCTSEGVWVRHHSMQWLLERLKNFELLWLEQVADVTMNGNPVRTVHLIAQKMA